MMLDNSISAYEKAITMDPNDHLIYLNFIITLWNGF